LPLEEIVEGGLCIGCGLCQAVAGEDKIQIVLTPEGRERPVARHALDAATLERVNAICPGIRVEGAAVEPAASRAMHDLVWGPAQRLAIGYAGDPDVRYRASTGGVLTALGQFLLASGRAKFILHVADEATWGIQPRCKICPDAVGESADLAVSDVWPGGGPTGDDAGFNGIIVRTERGLELYQAALAAGAVMVEPRDVGFRDFDGFQPHQVRKKRAVWARLTGIEAAGFRLPRRTIYAWPIAPG
jgi:coenzyme F420-reducing hydrogenase beta subunit